MFGTAELWKVRGDPMWFRNPYIPPPERPAETGSFYVFPGATSARELTVVPLADHTGHDVIWHHFGEHQKVMEERVSRQRQAQGKRREEMVSQCILRSADALVVSPEWWCGIGDKRRDAIVEMISAETGIAFWRTPESHGRARITPKTGAGEETRGNGLAMYPPLRRRASREP